MTPSASPCRSTSSRQASPAPRSPTAAPAAPSISRRRVVADDHDRDLLERMRATATPGLEAGGIAIFEDGPARGHTWSTALGPGRARMGRLPWFLRVVAADPECGSAHGFGLEEARFDFLDLTTDDVEEGERIAAVYRQRTWWHGRGSGHGAAYVEVP